MTSFGPQDPLMQRAFARGLIGTGTSQELYDRIGELQRQMDGDAEAAMPPSDSQRASPAYADELARMWKRISAKPRLAIARAVEDEVQHRLRGQASSLEAARRAADAQGAAERSRSPERAATTAADDRVPSPTQPRVSAAATRSQSPTRSRPPLRSAALSDGGARALLAATDDEELARAIEWGGGTSDVFVREAPRPTSFLAAVELLLREFAGTGGVQSAYAVAASELHLEGDAAADVAARDALVRQTALRKLPWSLTHYLGAPPAVQAGPAAVRALLAHTHAISADVTLQLPAPLRAATPERNDLASLGNTADPSPAPAQVTASSTASVLVLSMEDGYARLLTHGVAQFLGLRSETVKLPEGVVTGIPAGSALVVVRTRTSTAEACGASGHLAAAAAAEADGREPELLLYTGWLRRQQKRRQEERFREHAFNRRWEELTRREQERERRLEQASAMVQRLRDRRTARAVLAQPAVVLPVATGAVAAAAAGPPAGTQSVAPSAASVAEENEPSDDEAAEQSQQPQQPEEEEEEEAGSLAEGGGPEEDLENATEG